MVSDETLEPVAEDQASRKTIVKKKGPFMHWN